jgi:ketosteroid isomerase-like protein
MRLASVFLITATSLSTASAQPPGKTPPSGKDKEAEEHVRKLERGFVEAFAKGSKEAAAHYERVLAEEVVITADDGQAMTRADFLKMAKSGSRGPVSVEQDDLKVQVFGETIVVTGRETIKGPPDTGIRYTHVYVKRREQWQIVVAQYTIVKRR